MKRRASKIIFGSALSVAAIAVAIDHTRHPLPEPIAVEQRATSADEGVATIVDQQSEEAPCAMDGAPCAMGEAPCSMD